MPNPLSVRRTPALPLQTRAAPVTTVDAEARTVTVVWTTGAAVKRRRYDWDRDRVVDFEEILVVSEEAIDLGRLQNGAPVLDSHDSWSLDSQLGVVDRAWLEGGQGLATLRFPPAGIDADADKVFAKVAAGILRNISVGYSVDQLRIEISNPPDGLEKWFVERWTPYELSIVAIPADPGAQVRLLFAPDDPAAARDPAVPRSFPVLFSPESIMPEGLSPTDPAVRAAPPATRAAAPAAPIVPPEPETRTAPVASPAAVSPPVVPATASAVDPVAAERARAAAIMDLGSRHGADAGFIRSHVDLGSSLDAFRAALLDKLAADADRTPTRSVVQVPRGGLDETATRRAAVTNALMHRGSVPGITLTDAAREYRGLTLLETARAVLEASGTRTAGLSKDELAQRAMSTSDFTAILADVTTNSLRRGYDIYPQTFKAFCRQSTLPDFKMAFRSQISEMPQLEKVGEDGEFKTGTITDGREGYKLETYGKIVKITRQVLINDNLGAFTDMPAGFGTSVATLESDIVWGILTANAAMSDSNALFHANHGNLPTAAALSVTAISAARSMMRKQKGLDGKTLLNITPKFLLVPTELETAAEKIVSPITPSSVDDVVVASIRSLTPIAEPRLSAASATAWYLAGDPGMIDTIEYAYLEGQTGPYTETKVGWEVDGMEVKCRLDFGAKAIDWRGLLKNAGSAG